MKFIVNIKCVYLHVYIYLHDGHARLFVELGQDADVHDYAFALIFRFPHQFIVYPDHVIFVIRHKIYKIYKYLWRSIFVSAFEK